MPSYQPKVSLASKFPLDDIRQIVDFFPIDATICHIPSRADAGRGPLGGERRLGPGWQAIGSVELWRGADRPPREGN